MNTPGKRALYDNLGQGRGAGAGGRCSGTRSRQDDWRSNPFKVKRVRNAIRAALESAGAASGRSGDDVTQASVVREPPPGLWHGIAESLEERVERILALVKNQDEY